MTGNTSLYEAFNNPAMEKRPAPLWFWNRQVEDMTTDQIREIVRESYKQSGFSGFGILPEWQTDYLSDDYFALYEAALDEGSKYGMRFSLYDENGFPSYNAGGLLKKNYPELTTKRLDIIEAAGTDGESVVLTLPEGKLMSAVAMNTDTYERVDIREYGKENRLKYTVPKGSWKVMAFVCVVDGRDGMDYLNPDSVGAFIDITYEEYYKRLRKYFDNGTITSAFYDEPSFWPAVGRTLYGADGARFWTPSFNKEYKKHHGGVDPALDYPALFMDIGDATTEARDKLHFVRSEMFATNYIGQLNSWCKDHGIELTGHMLMEETVNPVCMQGDLMKSFKHQAIPGVDVICNYGFSQEAYKIISSSAYNWDKAKVMSESFGVFGGQAMDDFYKSAMDQFAKGINLIIPHALWYDDDPKYVTFVPELSYRSPVFGPRLKSLSDYIARSHVMLQNGRHIADIAMLYPIDYLESRYIFNGEQNNPADADYMQLSEILSLSARRDFTYLHPDILDEKCSAGGDMLYMSNQVNREEFRVFIIPSAKVISLSNLEKIKSFYDGGGKVIATTQLPCLATTAKDNEKVAEIIKDMFGEDAANTKSTDSFIYRSSSDYSGSYSAAMAFDGVYGNGSRWNAGKDGGEQWLEVEFPRETEIDRTMISERFDRTLSYRIQYFDSQSESYSTCCTGGKIGPNRIDTFDAVTTRRLRLYIDETNGSSVSIEEFEVYNGDSDNLALDTSDIACSKANEKGGKTYFIKSNPARNLTKALDDALPVYDVKIEETGSLSGGYLSYIHKAGDAGNVYFFANSSDDEIDTTVQIRGALSMPMFWDPVTGQKVAANHEIDVKDGIEFTRVKLKLLPISSLFLVDQGKTQE